MRRSLATLTASAVLIPLAVTAMPGAASAATNTLTVHVYNREGAKFTTEVYASNLSNRLSYRLTSNKPRKLPKGTYVVAAEILSGDGTSVVGGRTVKVSGASSTVIDGRKGKLVEPALSPAAAGSTVSSAVRICAGSNLLVNSWPSSERRYVIPNGSDNLRFSYAATWQEPGATASYTMIDSMKGLPNGYRRTVQRSSLVPVTLTAGSQASGSHSQNVYLVSRAGGCAKDMIVDSRSGIGGFKVPVYLSPGKWQFQAETRFAHSVRNRTLVSGGSYSQAFFGAGRGPGTNLPYNFGPYLHFHPGSMFTDPGFGGADRYTSDSWSGVGGIKSSITLTKGGKTLKKQTQTSARSPYRFDYLTKSAGWYGLTVHAKQENADGTLPSGLLSYRTTARFRFYSDPTKRVVAPVYLTRFTPAGLSLGNEAAPGSTTNVGLTLERKGQSQVKLGTAPKVKTITAWASYDNGATWKKTTVKKSGSKWVATVKNPKSGYVTLRAKVVDTKGNSSDITIYRAYRIA